MPRNSVFYNEQFVRTYDPSEHEYQIYGFNTTNKYDLEVYFKIEYPNNMSSGFIYKLPSEYYELVGTTSQSIVFDSGLDFSNVYGFRVMQPMKHLELNTFPFGEIDIDKLNENFSNIYEYSELIREFVEFKTLKLDRKNNNIENTVLPPLKENETWVGMTRVDGNTRQVCGLDLTNFVPVKKVFSGVETESLISTTIEETFSLAVDGTHEIELDGYKGNLLVNFSLVVTQPSDETLNYNTNLTEVAGTGFWGITNGYFGTSKETVKMISVKTEKDLKINFDGEHLTGDIEITAIIEILTISTEI